jgi:phosphomannomutase
LADQRIHGAALKALVALDGELRPGGSISRVDIRTAYLEALAGSAAGLQPLCVAWDCGNGATGPLVERLVARLPGRHLLLHTRVDGRFPNHHPDPAMEENLSDLKSAVEQGGCDLGIAFDGDGDRIGVVDSAGEVLWADQLLLFLAQDLLLERPGATVVADVKSSRLLFDGVRAHGGRAVMAPSGYVLIRETMRREAALLGGELSGHIFFADSWHGVDDALYAAMRTLLALARSAMTLRQFRQSLPPTIATPECRIACSRPAQVVAQTAARLTAAGASFDDRMGLRVSTPDGWWLLRTSGTEPKITCRCEAADAFGLARLNSELCGHLRACGIEPPEPLQPTCG